MLLIAQVGSEDGLAGELSFQVFDLNEENLALVFMLRL